MSNPEDGNNNPAESPPPGGNDPTVTGTEQTIQGDSPQNSKQSPGAAVVSSPAPLPTPDGEKDGNSLMSDIEQKDKIVPVILEPGLQEKDFFHGLLPREDIELMLRRNGDYVLRITELQEKNKKPSRELCLTVYWNGNVLHYLLRPNSSKRYTICSPSPSSNEKVIEFETVAALVEYYMKTETSFSANKIVIKKPIGRQDWELRHRDIICKIKLGSGAFGEVFSGELIRKKTSVKVAIKMLKGEKADKKKIQEIMNEARVMRPIKHKHVVRCYGVAADVEPLMIVMELISGNALDIFLKTHPAKITLSQKVNMVFDAALGLEYVHSKNVLHRDIAARNCLYDSKILKVSDFGLSVVGDKHTLVDNEKAPVRWLSPEVFRTREYTRAADVWAFGVLTWEIFNDAEEPYKGMTQAQIQELVALSGSKLEIPDSAGPNMAKLLAEVFEVDPIKRLSMADVVKRIEKFAPMRDRNDEEYSQEDGKRKKSSKRSKDTGGTRTEQGTEEENLDGKKSKVPRVTSIKATKPSKIKGSKESKIKGSKESRTKKGLSKEGFKLSKEKRPSKNVTKDSTLNTETEQTKEETRTTDDNDKKKGKSKEKLRRKPIKESGKKGGGIGGGASRTKIPKSKGRKK